jgi:Holliday junction resolvase RusA-like endonuclease
VILYAAIVVGAPRTKKNHGKVVKRGKRRFHVPSEAYTTWCAKATLQMRLARRGAPPIDRPVNVAARFYRDAVAGDAVGYYQGLADALQAAGVVVDDKHIVTWDGSRLHKDAARPRVEIEITEVNS